MGRPLLFPDRRRCRTCRRYFGFAVVMRLYCSNECAGRATGPFQPADLPRSCRVWKGPDKGWQPKRVFWSEYAVRKWAKRHKVVWYRCDGPDGCGLWHVATKQDSKE